METTFESLLDDNVASPPSIFISLQKALKDPETTYVEFAYIISADPGLAARILKVVNSPFYGFSTKIDSIAHAINIIGTAKLTELALATLVIEKFKGIPKDLIHMDLFWKHSIACGLASKIIAKLKNEDPDRFYLGGLLHDVGALLLYKQIPAKCRLIIKEARETEKNLFKVEKENLGFDHAELGGALLEKWLLPPILVEAVKYHNDPIKAELNTLYTFVVHLSDIIAYEMGLGTSGESVPPELNPETLNRLQLKPKNVDEVKHKIRDSFEEIVASFLN